MYSNYFIINLLHYRKTNQKTKKKKSQRISEGKGNKDRKE